MRVFTRVAVVAFVLGVGACAHRAPDVDVAPTPAALANTQRVFLEPLGRTADAVQARALLAQELVRRGTFTVVETREQADAVLRGEIVLRRAASGRPAEMRAYGTVTMLARGSSRVLWQHVYSERAVEPQTVETTPTELLQRVVTQFCDQLERDAAASAARR